MVRSRVLALALAVLAATTSLGQAPAVSASAGPGRAPLVRGPVEHLVGTSGSSAVAAPAVDDRGRVTAVWRQKYQSADGTTVVRIRAAQRRIGGRWSRPQTIGCRELSCPDARPAVGVDARGAVTAAWISGSTVMVARRPSAGPWSDPRVIATMPRLHPWRLEVAVARDGAVFVVWDEPPDSGGSVWASHRSAQGRWQTPVRLARGSLESAEAVGVSATGTAVVAFVRSWDEDAWATRFVPGRGWEEPERVGENDSSVFWLSVAVSREGRALVAWNAIDYYSVRVREMSRRGVWGRARDLSGRSEDVFAGPVSVIDSAGTATVAYLRGFWRVRGTVARKPAGGAWRQVEVTERVPRSSWEQLVVNRRNDLAVAFGDQIALRPQGSRWSATARGRGALAILPGGSALRVWATDSELKAQRLHVA